MVKKVLVVLGPTAVGKTDLAIYLAKEFNGELIACDSRQVYKGLDIGTGKLPGKEVKVTKGEGFWEMDGVRVWMYDLMDFREQFSVKDYIDKTLEIIEDVFKRGKLPIIVGGTGLYLKGLLEGISVEEESDLKLRKELEVFSVEELQKKLRVLSPIVFEGMNFSDRANKRRLIRKIEQQLMYPYINTERKTTVGISSLYPILKLGLTAPRPILNSNIDTRLDNRLKEGLIEEAVDLHNDGLSYKRMRELGLEYGVLAELLEGKLSKEEFIQKLKIKIHQYAKRQQTWFKREKGVRWFDITKKGWRSKLEREVDKWYHAGTYEQEN